MFLRPAEVKQIRALGDSGGGKALIKFVNAVKNYELGVFLKCEASDTAKIAAIQGIIHELGSIEELLTGDERDLIERYSEQEDDSVLED